MDFDLSEEQRLLKESVDGLLADTYDFEQRKTYGSSSKGWSADVWKTFAEQGLLGLPFAEADGGIGAGPVETSLVMEAFGRALVLEPYFATVVLGGGLLRHGASDAQRKACLPSIIDGSRTAAFAQLEKDSRYDLGDVATSAKKKADGWVIRGKKHAVQHGDTADILMVTARSRGDRRDRSGIGVFLVPADAAGVVIKSYATHDGLRTADIAFEDVEIGADAVLGDAENGLPLVERVADEARAALCSEAVGAMDEALKLTVDYLKTRQQFGTAIGTFQALQHRASDMFVALEQARGMALYATMAVGFNDPKERADAIAAAKVQVGRSLKFVGQQAIQLHGGVGMTMEYRIGHYFKRLTMIDSTLGDADFHVRRLAAGGGLFK